MEDLLRNAVEELKTSFSGPENTQELLTRVKSIVPFEENGFKTINVQGSPGQFKATIKTTFRDEKDIEMFVRSYEINIQAFNFGSVKSSTTRFPHSVNSVTIKLESGGIPGRKSFLPSFNHTFKIFVYPWCIIMVKRDWFFRHNMGKPDSNSAIKKFVLFFTAGGQIKFVPIDLAKIPTKHLFA